MTEADVRAQYLQEPWGQLLNAMGLDPYNTESMAREVAKYAADRIAALEPHKPEPGAHYIERLSLMITVAENGAARLDTEVGVSYGDEIEAMILAQFMQGINVGTEEYAQSVIDAVDAISNNVVNP